MKKEYVVTDIELWLKTLDQPIIYTNATTYEKGNFFCIYCIEEHLTYKYPTNTIFRVIERYTGKKISGDVK